MIDEKYEPMDFLNEKTNLNVENDAMHSLTKPIHRGDIFWIDIHFTTDVNGHKIRPCIILQNDREITSSKYVTVIPMTSKVSRTDMDTHIILGEDSMATVEAITTVPKTLIQNYYGTLNKTQLQLIMIATQKHLGFL